MDMGRWALATRATTTAPCGPGQRRCVASGTPHKSRDPWGSRTAALANRCARASRATRCHLLSCCAVACCARCRRPQKRCFPHYGQSHPALAADAPEFWQVASWTPAGGFESHWQVRGGEWSRRGLPLLPLNPLYLVWPYQVPSLWVRPKGAKQGHGGKATVHGFRPLSRDSPSDCP